MADPQIDLDAGFDREVAAIRAAIADGREPQPDWRSQIDDAVGELERIVEQRERWPDAAMRASGAVDLLLGVWLDVDQVDAVYLGEVAP